MHSPGLVTARQIRLLEGPYLKWVHGNDLAHAHGVCSPEMPESDHLVLVSKPEDLENALKKATLIVVENNSTFKKIDLAQIELSPQQALWQTPAIKAAMVLLLPLFDPRNRLHDLPISAGAHIHPTAQIGEGTKVDAGAMIGAFVLVGKNCHIHSGVVIEPYCQIGDRVILQANCVIGSDGFGYATGPDKVHHKVPHIGKVIIENDVEIGGGTVIDRGTIGETRIGSGTKIDNICHIAHNCQIGKRGLLAAGFMMAGSSTIGDDFMCGGDVVVSDHVTICNSVSIGGRGVVTKNITKPGAYTGYPLEPLRDGLRTLQNLRHLSSIRKNLDLVLNKLNLSASENKKENP